MSVFEGVDLSRFSGDALDGVATAVLALAVGAVGTPSFPVLADALDEIGVEKDRRIDVLKGQVAELQGIVATIEASIQAVRDEVGS